MTAPSPAVPETAERAVVDTLLLIPTEGEAAAGGVPAELLRRLSEDGRLDAQPFPLGADAHARWAVMMERSPARVVAVPLSASSQDSLAVELGELLRWATAWWPEVPFLQAAPLGTMGYLVDWAARRISATLQAQAVRVPRGRTAVLVVGAAGASPLANAEVCAISRLLWEEGDYGLVETAFVHDGRRPSVIDLMTRCEQAGMQRLVVLPLAILEGHLLTAVRSLVGQFPASEAGMDIIVAGPILENGAAAAVIRERYHEARLRWQDGREDGHSAAPDSSATTATAASSVSQNILPPRYRGAARVSSNPMRSAPLSYDADGQVAWDTIWQSFCDLALAGGPPHRGTLLEPASREEVLRNSVDYARVVAEIARGLSMITGFPVVTDSAAGWVGLVCPDEPMAIWMLRAIVVENVSVRRQGATLFLPAGPDYRIEKEIRNVITAVAKTHHYWTEHLNAP